MGNGYTRNDTANNIADGNVINASDLDGEFDKLQTAFDGTSGHSHDGTSGEGPQIDTTGIANDAVTGAKIDSTTTITAAGFTGPLTGTASNAALLDSLDSTQFLRSDVEDTKTAGPLNFSDNVSLRFGNGNDLLIYHDGSNNFIAGNNSGNNTIGIKPGGTGAVLITNSDGDNIISQQGDVAHLHHNGFTKLVTKSDGVDITGELQSDSLDVDGDADISGTLTMGGNINIQDGDALRVGTGADLRLYHDGSDSYIDDVGTGDLYIRANDQLRLQKYTGENLIVGNVDSSVQLYYDNAEKLATTSGGVTVTGTASATTFSGDLNGTINTATTATTQSSNNNTTKIATTAFVQQELGQILVMETDSGNADPVAGDFTNGAIFVGQY